jgi:hypothetical protein
MAGPTVQSQEVLAVAIGSFNPRIFEPLWLSNHGLIPEDEAEAAPRQQIDSDMSQISLPWAELLILKDRLQIGSRNEIVNEAQVRDLLVGMLRLLPHTPISLVSINHRVVLSAQSEEQWHGVGHILAPKEMWDGILDQPGMLDFAMQGVRPDDLEGAIKVRIQPTFDVQWGVFVNVNDEFSIPQSDVDEPAARAADLVEKVWPDAEERTSVIHGLLFERIFR